MMQAVTIIEVASYRMRMAQGESALLAVVEYQALVLLIEADHLDLVRRMYYCQLTVLASLVHDAIGEWEGGLVTYICNVFLFIHHLFAVYTKQDSKHLACSYAHAAFPLELAFAVVKWIDNVFHLILDQEAVEKTVCEGDGQLVWQHIREYNPLFLIA